MTKIQLQTQFDSLEELYLESSKMNALLGREIKLVSDINTLNPSIIATYKNIRILSESAEDSYKKMIEYDSEIIKHRNSEISSLTQRNKNMFMSIVFLCIMVIINFMFLIL